MQFYGKQPIKLSYRPAKFVGHSPSGSGVKMILFCHMILQYLVIKGSCDFIDGSP